MTDPRLIVSRDAPQSATRRARTLSWLVALAAALLLIAAISGSAVTQAAKAVEWARFDVTIEVQPNGNFHVTERQEVDFQGGPFRSGFAVIPLSRIDNIGNLTVSEDTGGALSPL